MTASLSLGITILIWLNIFGLNRFQPKGLLWNTPVESEVKICNVIIHLKQDFNAEIDFLMRPYTENLFWEKVKEQSPYWMVYSEFIDNNFPVLLGVSDYKIIEKVAYANLSFFYYTVNGGYGARRISLFVCLDKQIEIIRENTYALNITDFWGYNKDGFLDKIKIIMEEGMTFSGYELTPNNSKKPDRFQDREIVWENRDTKAPEKIRLIFSIKQLPR